LAEPAPLAQWLRADNHRSNLASRMLALKGRGLGEAKLEAMQAALVFHALDCGLAFVEGLESLNRTPLMGTFHPDVAIVETAGWFCGLLTEGLSAPRFHAFRLDRAGRGRILDPMGAAFAEIGDTAESVAGIEDARKLLIRRVAKDYADTSLSESIGVFVALLSSAEGRTPSPEPSIQRGPGSPSLALYATTFAAKVLGERVAGLLDLVADAAGLPRREATGAGDALSNADARKEEFMRAFKVRSERQARRLFYATRFVLPAMTSAGVGFAYGILPGIVAALAVLLLGPLIAKVVLLFLAARNTMQARAAGLSLAEVQAWMEANPPEIE